VRTRTFLAAGALSVIACAKLADLEGSVPPPSAPGEGGPASPSHLAGDVVIQPTSLEFGPVVCGEKATPQPITIRNTTDVPLPYEVRVPEGSGFVLESPAKGEIPPTESVTISVTVQPASPNDLNGAIAISAGASYMEVAAHAIGKGAVLEFVPNAVEFGQVRTNDSAMIPIELKNTGSAPAMITAFEGGTNALQVPLPATLTIPAGESRPVDATVIAPSAPGSLVATIKPSVASAICGALPELLLRAEAIDTTVTFSVADFGTVDCNTTGATAEVTIRNYSPNAVTVAQATLPDDSRFEVVSDLPLTVPGGTDGMPSTAKLELLAKPVGIDLGTFEETVTLSLVGVDEDQRQRTTKARIDVRGAILEMSPTSLQFATNGWIQFKAFTLRNTGNAPIRVVYDFRQLAGLGIWFPEDGPEMVEPNKSVNMDLGFLSKLKTEHRATMTPRRESGAVACTPIPVGTARAGP